MLLDTHVWLWIAEAESRRIGPKTRRAVERARERNDLLVCAISEFEIAALHVLGDIDVSPSVELYVRESMATFGFKVVDVTATIALNAGFIPTTALADPIDRLIVAAAVHSGEPLVTRDDRILDYARTTRRVRVIDAAQ